MPPKILVMAGALRKDSYNRKLARLGAEALRALGAEVDELDMREIDMPLYDGDLEDREGLPPGARLFKGRLAAAQGFMFASPEYNNSIPGPFKNALDWASRGEDDPFEGKVAALMGTSTGMYGAIRMLPHLRQVMTQLGVWLVPSYVAIPRAAEAFDAEGKLVSERFHRQVERLAKALYDEVARRG